MIKKLIGLAIVLLIVGATIPTTRAKLKDVVRPVTNMVKNKLVPRKLVAMADQLEIWSTRSGRIPAQGGPWIAWLRSSYAGSPQDPWGNLYYVVDGRRGGFTVGSMGPDATEGTEDDITETRR